MIRSSLRPKLQTILGGVILSSILAGFICSGFVHTIFTHISMDMSHGEHMNASLIGANCCDGSSSNHMELWKSTLVGIFETVLLLLVLFAVLYVAVIACTDLFNTTPLSLNLYAGRFRQYAREHPNIRLFNFLRHVFSRGILNPKLY